AADQMTDPRAWRADTLDEPPHWYYPLPAQAWAALEEEVAPLRRRPRPVTELTPSAELRAACAPALEPVLAALETGRGFAVSVCAELRRRRPEALEVLQRPFHIDRRGGVRPDEAPTTLAPVLQWHGGELVCRYLRYWIHAGHERAGVPLTAEQVRALDALD